MKTIEIVISPSGESRVETKGFAGSQCQEASRFLEASLGTTKSEKLTVEYHGTHAEHKNHLEQET